MIRNCKVCSLESFIYLNGKEYLFPSRRIYFTMDIILPFKMWFIVTRRLLWYNRFIKRFWWFLYCCYLINVFICNSVNSSAIIFNYSFPISWYRAKNTYKRHVANIQVIFSGKNMIIHQVTCFIYQVIDEKNVSITPVLIKNRISVYLNIWIKPKRLWQNRFRGCGERFLQVPTYFNNFIPKFSKICSLCYLLEYLSVLSPQIRFLSRCWPVDILVTGPSKFFMFRFFVVHMFRRWMLQFLLIVGK